MAETAVKYRSAHLSRGKSLKFPQPNLLASLRIRELVMKLFVMLVVKTDTSNQTALIIPGISEVKVPFLIIKLILFLSQHLNLIVVLMILMDLYFISLFKIMLDTGCSTILF